ncbi:MAG: extracellular solute-binding protein [Anaerolineales bacterium]|nr:extracellular solute-binding protein [Anaerolineales bacterium]
MNTFHKLGFVLLIFMITLATLGLAPTSRSVQAQGETLTIWHSWQGAEQELLDTWIANYTGDVTLNTRFIYFDDLQAAYQGQLEAGAGPDLVLGAPDWAQDFRDSQSALALNAVIAGTPLEANLPASSWELMAAEGDYYGIPVSLDGVALYYNRDILPDDEVPTTFDEMLEIGVERTTNEIVGLIFDRSFYTSAGMYLALGGQLFDPITGANLWNSNGAAVRFLELHREVFQASDEIYGGAATRFSNGQAAMIIDGSWQLADYQAALGDRLGIALLPDIDGNPWQPYINVQGFYVNPNGKVEAALAFMTYVTSTDNLLLVNKIAGLVPPVEEGVIDDPSLDQLAAQFANGVPLPTVPIMTTYMNTIDEAITATTEGAQTPEDAAGAAQATLEEAATARRTP